MSSPEFAYVLEGAMSAQEVASKANRLALVPSGAMFFDRSRTRSHLLGPTLLTRRSMLLSSSSVDVGSSHAQRRTKE